MKQEEEEPPVSHGCAGERAMVFVVLKRKRDRSDAGPFKLTKFRLKLGFADAEHLRAACRAGTLGGGAAVFHGDRLGITHFPPRPALHTVGLHPAPPKFGLHIVDRTMPRLQAEYARNSLPKPGNSTPIGHIWSVAGIRRLLDGQCKLPGTGG